MKYDGLKARLAIGKKVGFLEDIKNQIIKRIDENSSTKINDLDLKLQVKKY